MDESEVPVWKCTDWTNTAGLFLYLLMVAIDKFIIATGPDMERSQEVKETWLDDSQEPDSMMDPVLSCSEIDALVAGIHHWEMLPEPGEQRAKNWQDIPFETVHLLV